MLHRVEYLDSSASVESSRFQQPKIAVLRVISAVVDWFREYVDLLLDVWVLPGHIGLKLAQKIEGKVSFLCLILPWIIFLEELKERFHVILTILVIKI